MAISLNLDESYDYKPESFEPLPEGEHELIVQEATMKFSNNTGTQFLSVKFFSQKHNRSVYQSYFPFYDGEYKAFMMWKIKELLLACSIITEGEKNIDFDERSLEGCKVFAKTKNKIDKNDPSKINTEITFINNKKSNNNYNNINNIPKNVPKNVLDEDIPF